MNEKITLNRTPRQELAVLTLEQAQTVLEKLSEVIDLGTLTNIKQFGISIQGAAARLIVVSVE